MRKITVFTLSILMTLGLMGTSAVLAADPKTDIRCGVNIAAGQGCGNASTGNSIGNIIERIINILSVLIGAVAVIVLMYGGFRYVTSAGNDQATAAAKNTIIYAIVGLIIVGLAQVIVKFVLHNVVSGGASTTSSQNSGTGPGSSNDRLPSQGRKPILPGN